MKKIAFIIGSIIGVIVVLLVIQIYISNSLSTKGIVLAKLEDEISSLKKENSVLKEEYLTSSSYMHVASKAAEMGFIKQKTIEYINTSVPIALR